MKLKQKKSTRKCNKQLSSAVYDSFISIVFFFDRSSYFLFSHFLGRNDDQIVVEKCRHQASLIFWLKDKKEKQIFVPRSHNHQTHSRETILMFPSP